MKVIRNEIVSNEPYFIGKSGKKYYYKDIKETIEKCYPEVKGKHIFQQLEKTGMKEEFDGGYSPYGLPYSFV